MKLKHLIKSATVALALLTITIQPCAAETHYKPHISVGAHGGLAMSRMSFSPGVSQSWLTSPQIGVQVRYAEERLFGLVAELNFVQRGWKENFEDNTLQYSRTLNYITLPVMTHIYFGSRRFKGYFNLGPEVGYMISDNISSNFDYHNPASAGISARQTDQLTMEVSNHFDYGITAGMGMEFYLQPRHSVNVEARFYYGLGNIFPSKRADTFSASRTMSLSVTLGYNFRIK